MRARARAAATLLAMPRTRAAPAQPGPQVLNVHLQLLQPCPAEGGQPHRLHQRPQAPPQDGCKHASPPQQHSRRARPPCMGSQGMHANSTQHGRTSVRPGLACAGSSQAMPGRCSPPTCHDGGLGEVDVLQQGDALSEQGRHIALQHVTRAGPAVHAAGLMRLASGAGTQSLPSGRASGLAQLQISRDEVLRGQPRRG